MTSVCLRVRGNPAAFVPMTFLCGVFQIVKVLNLYTPVNEFEERVSVAFIRTIQVIYTLS